MAVYKVIQDIEAEDKLLGPLTLKSLVYAAIAGVLAFISFRLALSGGPTAVKLVIVIILLPPMLLFGVLASPLGRDQPTEVWLLSRVRFLIKQHKRLWNQSGINQLVTITAPKKLEEHLTKGFSQTEVRSRLQALATTLDSRGWAVKNVAVNTDASPGYLDGVQGDSDRLIGTSSLPQEVAVVDVHPSDDILDENNNATAQNFAALVQQSEANRKKEIANKMEAMRKGETFPTGAVDTTFLDQQPKAGGKSSSTVFVGRTVITPGQSTATTQVSTALTADDEQQLLAKRHKEDAEIESKMPKNFGSRAKQNVGRIDSKQVSTTAPAQQTQPAVVTPEKQAAKLELAQSGNALSVASIAHLANRESRLQQIGPNEVVISLH